MLFEIKHRFSQKVLFSLECESMKLCVGAAVKAGANLTRANLAGADLTDANLAGANLTRANLAGADLTDANLAGADLTRANLAGADLTDANLAGADLTRADLAGANLAGANLTGANLTGANLTAVRDDIFAVLSSSPKEVQALRDSVASGKVDGSVYEGDCACLLGTLANARHCNFAAIPGLTPNSHRPAEKWFFNIRKGDTPETNQFSKIALGWIDEWLANMRAAFSSAA